MEFSIEKKARSVYTIIAYDVSLSKPLGLNMVMERYSDAKIMLEGVNNVWNFLSDNYECRCWFSTHSIFQHDNALSFMDCMDVLKRLNNLGFVEQIIGEPDYLNRFWRLSRKF